MNMSITMKWLLMAALALPFAVDANHEMVAEKTNDSAEAKTKNRLLRAHHKKRMKGQKAEESKTPRIPHSMSPSEIMPLLSPYHLEQYLQYGCEDLANSKAIMPACKCGLLSDAPFDQDGVENTMIMKTTTNSAAASVKPQQQQNNAECINGRAGNYPCSNVDLLAHVPLSTFRSFSANDIWGWTDDASGREFALMGIEEGIVFVEVTNPSSPIYWGKLTSSSVGDSPTSWRDIKVYQSHAFAVAEASGYGMLVFDLTRLLSSSLQPGTEFKEDALYNGVSNSHNIVINEDSGFAYLVGTDKCNGGLHMVDIRNPKQPSFAGCYSADGYTHDAHCLNYQGPDSNYVGREICICCNEDTVTIVDVSKKQTPVQISRTMYKSDRYTHQGWLSPDQQYFVFGDEWDEREGFGLKTRTMVLDVSDLSNPTNFQEFFGPTTAVDHNQYIVRLQGRDFTFQANYAAGLQVYEILDYDTAAFKLVGNFDIYPSDDSAQFFGAWSVFPYFPSGTVVVSGISEGLFVLRPTFLEVGDDDDDDDNSGDDDDDDQESVEWVIRRFGQSSRDQCLLVPGNPNCIMSDNRGNYRNDVECELELVSGSGRLVVKEFDVEEGYDGFTLNRNSQLLDTKAELEGITMSSGDRLTWRSDWFVAMGGWLICIDPSGSAPRPPACTDDESFRDIDGYGCDVYEEFPQDCDFCDIYANPGGVSACDVCCACK